MIASYSYNLVSPDDPSTHTQTVEGSWRTLKGIIPAEANEESKTYLAEYEFIRRVHWYDTSVGERIMSIDNITNMSFNNE